LQLGKKREKEGRLMILSLKSKKREGGTDPLGGEKKKGLSKVSAAHSEGKRKE